MGTSMAIPISNVSGRANDILEYLVDHGPSTSSEICDALCITKGAFSGALTYAREFLCPTLAVTIPHPLPTNGWRYMVTDDWRDVEQGAGFSLGQAEARLESIRRDVATIRPKLDPRSIAGRRANFLDKHLSHILNTLREITDGEG